MTLTQSHGRIGVLGGTFDPIHLGHLITAADVKDYLCLDRVLFVPNSKPPHKQGQAVSTVEDRVEMVKLALASNPDFEVDLTEVERPGLSYALDTMRLIASSHPEVEVFFILGFDALMELDTWHKPDTLLAEFRLAVMNRCLDPTETEEGIARLRLRFPSIDERIELAPVTRIDISSTEVRERVSAGRTVRYLVPDAVLDHIGRRGLYRQM